MKTAVSIPDDIFEKAEDLARRMKKSRSKLFSNALEEYVSRHAPDRACAEIGFGPDSFVSSASAQVLEQRDL